jgi:hypothetical protein
MAMFLLSGLKTMSPDMVLAHALARMQRTLVALLLLLLLLRLLNRTS